ncbi:MAG: cupin domain-containing protein [Bacteroidota bacterium]
MHLTTFHNSEKPLSAKQLFNGSEGKVVAIHLKKGGELKEHITKVPALLIGVMGEIVYEDEKGQKINLKSGDFTEIEPQVKHWLVAKADSEAILIK